MRRDGLITFQQQIYQYIVIRKFEAPATTALSPDLTFFNSSTGLLLFVDEYLLSFSLGRVGYLRDA